MNDQPAVIQRIDEEELADLAVTLGSLDSPPGQEKSAADFVADWLSREGFPTRITALFPERPNVVGTLDGCGDGYSLLFNAHLDTSVSPRDIWTYRDPLQEIDHRAWREGRMIFGNGVVNDKGPLACFLLAAKAIKQAGVELKGDLILSAVSGEIEQQPADEFTPPRYLSHEVGARYMVTHGVYADYALVAENTQFEYGPLEAGRLIFKVTLFSGPSLYAPYINRPYPEGEDPNAIVRMSRLIEEIEAWAMEYEKKHTYENEYGTLIPKINIGAIRGGAPYFTAVTPEVCAIYLDVRTFPGQDPSRVKAELRSVVGRAGFEVRVEPILFQRGYEARGADRLAESLARAHRGIFDRDMKTVRGPRASMWRDTNVFNEVGIPAVSYGPGSGRGGGGLIGVSLDDLHAAAKIYALVALDICRQEKEVV